MKNKVLKKKYFHVQVVSILFILIGAFALYYSIFNQISMFKAYSICFMIYFAAFLYKTTRTKELINEARNHLIQTSTFEHKSSIDFNQYEKIAIDDKVFYLINDNSQNIYIAKIKSLDDINLYLNPFVQLCNNDLQVQKKRKSVGLLFMFESNQPTALTIIKNNPVAQLPMHMRKLKKAYMFLSAYDETTHTFYFHDSLSDMILGKNNNLSKLINKIESIYKKDQM